MSCAPSCSGTTAGAGVRLALLTVSLAAGASVLWNGAGSSAAASSPVAAQQQAAATEAKGTQASAPQLPRFRAGATLVRVDVYATVKGQPVADLTAADFEVLEDGKPQKVEAFDRVTVRATRAEESRVEPSTVQQMRQAAADPGARVFVVFLDTYHVMVSASHRMQQPLARLLDGLLGDEDLVAVMTPEMSAGDITFTRRGRSIAEELARRWDWGVRDSVARRSPEEQRYAACYPGTDVGGGVAITMIDRRRERQSLDALWDLTLYLDGLREGRKAVIVVSEGWKLFRPDQALMPSRPSIPGVGVGPDGRLRTGSDPLLPNEVSPHQCDRDRMMLAQIDNEQQFRDMVNEANRANVTFYPVDPRGLPVFDTTMRDPLPVPADQQQLRNRLDSLRDMALATDGVAVMGSNDIEGGIRRVVEDLSAYYLLGYYSTNTTYDGKFRSIKVRATRPGVEIRARRGYRAPTEEEAAARMAAAEAPGSSPNAATAALGALDAVRPQSLFRVRASVGWRSGGRDGALWLVGELDGRALQSDEWKGGGRAELSVAPPEGAAVATASVVIPPGERSFLAILPAQGGLPPGEYLARARVRAAQAGGLPYADSVRVTVSAPPGGGLLGQPLLYRRGPATGNQYQVTADPRYRRQDRVRIDVPLIGPVTSPAARLLDVQSKPLALTMAVSEREEDGARWMSADVALAPLASGDYLVEVSGRTPDGEQKVIVAFRIVP